MKMSLLRIAMLLAVCTFYSSLFGQTLLKAGIYDNDTKTPIAGAKFGVSDQGIGVITDSDGKFTYRKYHEVLDEKSTFQISANGYFDIYGDISVLRKLQNNRGVIYLEKITEKEVAVRQSTGAIAIFWDASAKSKYRNTEAEISYLRTYLQNTDATTFALTIFNEEIVLKKEGFISEENIGAIEKILSDAKYKGVSDYSLLNHEPVDEIMLFAEEQPVFGMFQLDQNVPVHIVKSSLTNEADDYFKSLATYTTGSYTSLAKRQIKEAVANEGSYIKGRYTSGDAPVPYAIISKKGLLKEFFTDAEGYFKVPATEGDVLTFYSLGNYPKTLEVTSKIDYVISAVPKAEQLETVALNIKRKRSENAFDSILQLDMVEGREVPVRSIYKTQFNRNAISIGDAIDGIYGVRSYFNPERGQTYFTVSGGCARVFVDGDEVSADAIPVGIVENISVYTSTSRVLPCPSRIIITTRMHPDRIDQRLREKGYSQLKNNIYKEELAVLETTATTTPYFQENTITGTVKGNGTVLQGASVLRKGTLSEVVTNANGEFSIQAAEGDILEIRHFGMYPKSIVVIEKRDYLVEMITKAEILDEVELSKTIDKPDTSYDSFDPNTRIEIVNGRKYDVRKVLYKEDLNIAGGDIFEMLTSSDPKIKLSREGIVYEYKGKIFPLTTIVDGIPMNPESINPLMIERVSVYISPTQNNSAPTVMGSRIFITTRNHPDIRKKFLADNDITLKNNNYNEEVSALKNKDNNYFESQTISGVVTVKNIPLEGASILKKGSLQEVISDRDGFFKIEAVAGDILEVKHAGMFPKTIVVDDSTKYDIALINRTEILDEVAVSAEKEEETKTITTGYGEKDKKAVGYAVDSELSKFVSSADISFDQVALKIPGVLVDPATKQLFFQRSFGAIDKSPIMIVLDGTIVSQNTLNSIDPQTITNITALKGVAATNKYGSQAFGGALLLETLNGASVESQEKPDLTIKNNIYKETLPTLNFDAVNEDYVDDVASKLSTKIKLEKYRMIKSTYLDKVDFYVDMALYFQQIDAGAAREVRNDFALLAKDNLKALRIVAYLHEHAGEYMQAQKVYERVALMDPSNPQSYRDLALIYQETGEQNKALELYVNMLGDQIPGIDFSPLTSVLSNELQRLINLYKHKINYQRLPNDWLATNFNIDVRMTASWSDTTAPFEFQFVNPKKRFYNWNSEKENNENNEKSTEEFVIDDAIPGKWLINVRYTGEENGANIPPYLKYTVYKDYGTPEETRTIKLVKLESQIQKVTLDSFTY